MTDKNITGVVEAYLCSNCGACGVACPTNAIAYKWSPIGRLYASIDENKCISCSICRKVCPSLDESSLHAKFQDRFVGNILTTYVCKSADNIIFKNSQSGGACTATLKYLFETGKIDSAIVCTSQPGTPPIAQYRIITSSSNLQACQKSQYTPVDMLSALKQVSSFTSVAFVGLPCHIEGLVNIQNTIHKYLNIKYKLGLVCDRVLCQGIARFFGDYNQSSTPYKITWRNKNFSYKGKEYSYNNAPVTITNDTVTHLFPNTYRFALKEFFTPPRCRVCYNKINVFADIVFGDPWRMPNIDEQNGQSLVLTRTELGDKLISEMFKNNVLLGDKRDNESAVVGQQIMQRKISVARFSKAIQFIPTKIDSYLYEQTCGGYHATSKDIETDRELITSFLHFDESSWHQIRREAYRIIHKLRFNNFINKTIVGRVCLKIYRQIK